ncbi:YgjV family protein [Inquilinus sp. CA228]|uniref:YgjV family protein n=1 Tax=Inquilinus sp. CA228 TaxID=3455609 RepID=UPI003F8D2069
MNWIEAFGYAGTGFTILAYSMRRLLPLRIVAILSSASFLVYAALIGSAPLMLMEAALLPINAWRLIELIRPVPAPQLLAQRPVPGGTSGRRGS